MFNNLSASFYGDNTATATPTAVTAVITTAVTTTATATAVAAAAAVAAVYICCCIDRYILYYMVMVICEPLLK